ncbi:MAG: hypothetical protein SNG10_02560 [Rikenellaceae bacterium]
MKQKTNLTAQIDKIVADTLLKSQAIYLPSLGTLYVDSLPSKVASSGRKITPPKYVVKYSSQQKGVSLVEVIMTVGRCDNATAERLYAKWFEEVKRANGAVIEGVGEIVNKNFNIASSLEMTLNPESYRVLKLKKRRGGWIWIAASIAVCAVVGVAANYLVQQVYLSKGSEIVEQIDNEVVVEYPLVESEQLVETQIEEVDTAQQLICTLPPPEVESRRYRVVYGVFSTEENAQKGAQLAYDANSEVIARVRPFGKMFMVSIFESEDVGSSKDFIERNKDIYTDLWIHKRRGE